MYRDGCGHAVGRTLHTHWTGARSRPTPRTDQRHRQTSTRCLVWRRSGRHAFPIRPRRRVPTGTFWDSRHGSRSISGRFTRRYVPRADRCVPKQARSARVLSLLWGRVEMLRPACRRQGTPAAGTACRGALQRQAPETAFGLGRHPRATQGPCQPLLGRLPWQQALFPRRARGRHVALCTGALSRPPIARLQHSSAATPQECRHRIRASHYAGPPHTYAYWRAVVSYI